MEVKVAGVGGFIILVILGARRLGRGTLLGGPLLGGLETRKSGVDLLLDGGGLAIRHLGIPTVTVPMGVADDIGMPVGLTFAGAAYDDSRLLAIAAAFEATGRRRAEPPRTPRLPGTAC